VAAEPLASNFCLSTIVLVALTIPAGVAAEDSVSTRFLGSPDGQYKLTLKISATEMIGTLQRLLIPNQTLWQQSVPIGTGFLQGFVTDTGYVLVCNNTELDSEPVVTALNPQAGVMASYSLNDLAAVLNRSAVELRQTAVSDGWMQGRAELVDGRAVSIPLGDGVLLVDTVNGGLTPIFD